MDSSPNTSQLAATADVGSTGLLHLKRLWSRQMMAHTADNPDWELDNLLLNLLGIGLLPAFTYLHQHRPGFYAFEQWVSAHHNGAVPPMLVQQWNSMVLGQNRETKYSDTSPVLTAADLQHWEQEGYVIVRQAVSIADAQAAESAIWDFLQMDKQDPASWYLPHEQQQGIMVNLYRHPAIDKNRQSQRIRKAFEQLWGHGRLVSNTDKVGFNPPETNSYQYRGTGLHWDVSLHRPIPFGTQGILYLTDTAADQGALTVVPGFHQKIEAWLQSLPAGTHPREADMTPYGTRHIAANAGDCIIWHHALPHAASPNRGATPRIVQYLNWFDPKQSVAPVWI